MGASILTQHQWRRNEFESGGTRPVRSAGIIFVVSVNFFGSTTSRICRFGERSRDGQYS